MGGVRFLLRVRSTLAMDKTDPTQPRIDLSRTVSRERGHPTGVAYERGHPTGVAYE
jgi:hypothetical protein